MKKMKHSALLALISVAALLVISPLLAIAGGDANQNSYVGLLTPTSTPATNAAVGIAAYKGNATIAVLWGTAVGAGHTGTVTITHSTTAGGTYSTVTNLAGTAGVLTCTGVTTNEVDTFPIDLGACHAFIKVAYTCNTIATNTASAVLIAPMTSN